MSCYKLNIELVDIANLILKNHDKFLRIKNYILYNYKLLLIF
jgi:hypothetical protein